MYLNGEDESKDMFLYINSPGGAVLAGISVYDAMQFVVPDVHTICMGLAASMGSFILTGGEITKRIALPHALCQCVFPLYLRLTLKKWKITRHIFFIYK
jgi:ATP-dependent Clp protease protease subunit